MLANLAFNGVLRDAVTRTRGHAVARAAIIATLTVLSLAGCYKRSVLPQSEGHVTAPATKTSLADVPPPARVSTFLPPPKPTVKPPTYSVVVSEVPVKELLFALARDTKQNVDIHPGLQGLVSLNAINETLPAILERVSKQVNMRYRIEGNTIIVSPDSPYMKTYKVNYVNMTRETTSTIGVSGQIQGATGGSTTGGAGGASSGGAATSGQTNASNTVVKTVSNNNFWESLRDNIRAILASTRNQSLTSEQRAERAETQRSAREERLQQAEAVARAGQAAPQLFSSVFGSPALAIPIAGDVRDDIVLNPVSGTISVLATEKQHALIQQHIDSISQISQRQVLIEATIAEVTLSDAYQGGIDWSRLANSGGISFTQSLIGSVPSAFNPGSLTIGYTNPTSSIGNIAASIKLLDQFGNTRVLSSPKLMALNNQTALLKVVDNIVYFTIEATTTTAANVGTNTTFNTTAQTVPVGMVITLTPQINDNGQVTLTVRPTITRINGFANDPNPSLCSAAIAASNAGKCLTNPVPQIQTREMESVLQLVSGQTAVLGGLMQDNTQYNRNSVPGVGNPVNTGVLSELFSMRDDKISKSELVIFLRSTMIPNPSLESDELKFYQRFLPHQTDTPTETNPGEKAGALR
ncbi:MAG TPA: secretin N-terminal domain-containing protein [Burkholderiales bacterium]|jgi:MSHA type pilus biogenesis protein MshL|nr:secretin N-terminal domain-containing protein [Burkholderiales bacterium]